MKQLEKLTGKQSTRPASHVKAHWRDIVAEANALGEVVVTNYNRAEVVVVSIERYSKLKADAGANDPLKSLRAEFDQELASLRDAKGTSRLRKAFAASPEKLAQAAGAALRHKR